MFSCSEINIQLKTMPNKVGKHFSTKKDGRHNIRIAVAVHSTFIAVLTQKNITEQLT